MEIKVMFVMLSSLLLFSSVVSLNGHEVLSSNDLAHGHEPWFGFHSISMARKLMLDPKVKGVEYKNLVSYDESSSGESHMGEEEASKATLQERSDPTRVFTMDYSPVRKRRPVHNKSFPTATSSP